MLHEGSNGIRYFENKLDQKKSIVIDFKWVTIKFKFDKNLDYDRRFNFYCCLRALWESVILKTNESTNSIVFDFKRNTNSFKFDKKPWILIDVLLLVVA